MAQVLWVSVQFLCLSQSLIREINIFTTGSRFLFPPCSPALYEKADIKAPEDKAAKHLIIGVTSDRGLCGAIHSGVAKAIKSEIANLTGSGKEVMVVNVGDKLRGLLHRYKAVDSTEPQTLAASQRQPVHRKKSAIYLLL